MHCSVCSLYVSSNKIWRYKKVYNHSKRQKKTVQNVLQATGWKRNALRR